MCTNDSRRNEVAWLRVCRRRPRALLAGCARGGLRRQDRHDATRPGMTPGGRRGRRQQREARRRHRPPTPISPDIAFIAVAQGEEPADRHGPDRRGRRARDGVGRGRAAEADRRPGMTDAIRTEPVHGQDGRLLPQRLPADRVHADGGLQAAAAAERRLRLRAGRHARRRRRRVPAPGPEPSGQLRADRLAAGEGGAAVHRGAHDATGS